MEYQWIAQGVLGILVTGLFGALKMLWTKTEQNAENLQKHAQRDAETYVTKNDHIRHQERIEDKLDRIINQHTMILQELSKKQDR